MHVDPVRTTALDTLIIIALKRPASLFLPFSDVWRRLAASPEVAFSAGHRTRVVYIPASDAAHPCGIGAAAFKVFAAYRAGPRFSARWSPSSNPVASKRTVFDLPRSNFGRRSVEAGLAGQTRKIFAVFRPIEWLSGDALIPRDGAYVVQLSAFRRAISSIAEFAWDRGRAPFAGVGLGFHYAKTLSYCMMACKRMFGAMADARIVDDAPLLAWGAMPEAAE
jgi:hypothetical protein